EATPEPIAPEKKKGNPVVGLLELAMLAAVPIIAFTSCGSHDSATGGTSTPQTTSAAAAKYSADEQAALDALRGACREDDGKLYVEAKRANELMQKAGINDETTLTVLQHLRDSLPADAPTMDCAGVLAEYTMLREKGTG
ncbi:hypothetical protein ACFWWS_37450, partial [Streptomyces sp. NPDC059083]|uniref:hypothetical protein n=1 Tax=Streptomyces sp. NPDC059083 TaxID=3346721 RepID=UPI0036C57FF0